MSNGIVQLQPDSSGKKVDTSEIAVGTNTVERQRINISDPVNANGHAEVKDASITGSEYGLVVRAFIHDIALSLKRPLDILARSLATCAEPASGRLRTITDINSGNIGTVTTCTTVTNINQMATFDVKQSLLYATERQNWCANIRSKVS